MSKNGDKRWCCRVRGLFLSKGKRMKKIKIGLIGCGTIGSGIAQFIAKKCARRAVIAFLSDTNAAAAQDVQKRFCRGSHIVPSATLIRRSEIVIEAASAAVSGQIAREALAKHKTVLIMSVGGLLKIDSLKKLLGRSKGTLLLPSGAIAGLDAAASARLVNIQKVTLTTSKPIKGLAGAPYIVERNIDLAAITEPTVIFSGTAADAVTHFPQNINVAAVLSLATIGPENVRVEIVTSPTFTRNTHRVTIEGDCGTITAVTENVPSPDNPKTSYLAILSACATLEKYLSPLKIGT